MYFVKNEGHTISTHSLQYIAVSAPGDDEAPAGLIRTPQCLYGSCKAETNPTSILTNPNK